MAIIAVGGGPFLAAMTAHRSPICQSSEQKNHYLQYPGGHTISCTAKSSRHNGKGASSLNCGNFGQAVYYKDSGDDSAERLTKPDSTRNQQIPCPSLISAAQDDVRTARLSRIQDDNAIRHRLVGQHPAMLLTLTIAFAYSEVIPGLVFAAEFADGFVDATSTAPFVPGPVEVGWQIWFGAFVGVVPFAIGAYEFGKRILIQRRCQNCGGSGLVQKGRFQRKCSECGGFFPWRGWGEFLSATARPGNGGPLRQPKGQTSVFYKVPEKPSGSLPEKASGTSEKPPDA